MRDTRAKYYAFDTETVNRAGGGHACLLLAENNAGGVDYVEFPTSWEQIYIFLAPRKCLIAYNAAFDIRAILHTKFFPLDFLADLAAYDCAVYRGFRFFHIPGKYLKCWRPGAGGFELFDIKSFFQGLSLRTAAEKFLPAERKITIPPAWYSEMDRALIDARRAKIIEYAAQDVKVLAGLYNVLAGSFSAIGITNPPLYSPGAVAMEVFGEELKRQQPTNTRNKFFKQAYYGGRIEISALGKIHGPLNYYDLKSAYPATIAELPDLSTALYRAGSAGWEYRADVKAGAYRVRVDVPTSWQFGPFAVRQTKPVKNIIFPVGQFDTWIMRDGLELCREYNIPFTVLEYGEYYAGVETKPFEKNILELFALRAQKDKNLAVKLILNSGYGKMAESDNYNKPLPPYLADIFHRYFNSDRLFGKYTNFAYAGIITERTRLKLWRAAHKYGAVLLATDGIITTGEMPASGKLGAWDFKGKISEAVILGCGRYKLTYADRPEPEYHFRGFSRPGRIFERMAASASDHITEKILDTKSLKQWHNSLDKSDFNVLKDIEKDIYIEDLKRNWSEQFPRLKDYFHKNINSTAINLI